MNVWLIIYIGILLYLVVWISFNTRFLKKLHDTHITNKPLVSIIIPLRNEEMNVPALVTNLKKLTYENIQFVLYNDDSTDQTLALLYEYINGDKRFEVIEGKSFNTEWVGKVHACNEASKTAKGDYYLFLDADVVVNEQIIEKLLVFTQEHNCDAISGFPRFTFTNWLDRLILPLMHFVVHLYLPIFFANHTYWTSTTAANGAFIWVRKQAYDSIGGHASVRGSLIEDVELARQLKAAHCRVTLINTHQLLSCHMYTNATDTWNGFLKNSFNGLNRSILLSICYTLVSFILFICPLFMLIFGIFSVQYVYIFPYLCIVIIRLVNDYTAGSPLKYAWFHPIAQFLLLCILWHAIYRTTFNKGFSWKGREYS